MLHTLRVPIRKISAAIPAVALLSVGVIWSAAAAPTLERPAGLTSGGSPAIVVPDIAMTLRGAGAVEGDSLHVAAPGALASKPPEQQAAEPAAVGAVAASPVVSLAPAGTDLGRSTPVTPDSTGIPVRALDSYLVAAALTNDADPGCNIDWALVAAIGKVESNHARFGGNQLDSHAVVRPGIIGMALDGTNGTARITDTDGGAWDGDTTYDRAVGPMQFIPGTWRAAGVDADGDGAKNPQDMADAATATAIYLCSGPGDLSTAGDLRSSILRYNHSDSYVRLVSSIAAAYRHGVTALPASGLPPADSSTENSNAPASSPARNRPALQAAGSTPRAPASSTAAPAPRRTTTPALRTTTQSPAPRTTTPAPRTTTRPPVPTTTTRAPAPTTTTTAPAPTTTTTTSSSWSGSSGSRRSGSGSSWSGSGSSRSGSW